MRKFLQNLIKKSGYQVIPDSPDPLLAELLCAYRQLRLAAPTGLQWQQRLSRVAASGHLRNLLRELRIECVLDVGANSGQFGRALREMGFSGRIISFEPMNQARSALEGLAKDDPCWEILPVALGSEAEKKTLKVFSDDTFSSLHGIKDTGVEIFGEYVTVAREQEVSVECLDTLWPKLFTGNKYPVVLLKTDTQGHDLQVLQGAGISLGKVSAVLTEAAIEPIYENAPVLSEIASYLEERGFHPSGFYPLSHRPDSLAMIELDAFFVRR